MLYSQLFGKTLKEAPQGVRSYQLLLRAGYVRQLSQGLYSLLPLGMMVNKKMETVIRDELLKLNGQEVMVPLVNPYELWKRGGRAGLLHRSLIRFRDRTGKELVLSPSHEEAMVELVRIGLNSYRDLPVLLYQFQTKFRDEEKVRIGPVKAKEFVMNDAYSFHRSPSDLNNFFPKMFSCYENIFRRLGLPVITSESGVGFMGGERAYEFHLPSQIGNDTVLTCRTCGYCANQEVATAIKEEHPETLLPMETIRTESCTTMERLSAFLNVPRSRLVKAMIFRSAKGFVMAVVRGDYSVSREKLSSLVGTPVLDFASFAELELRGVNPDYASPLQVPSDFMVVIDDTVANSNNLVMASGEPGKHSINVNYGRDFESAYVGDIVQVNGSHLCLQCGTPLEEIRTLELGNIFKLGDFYTRALGLSFMSERGESCYPSMGSYGIGMGRLLVAVAESHMDERGLVWPKDIAPFKFFLMGIGKKLAVKQKIFELYDKLGRDKVLLDDRIESVGRKFRDADLTGIPFRIILSSKHLARGEVEFFDRKTGAKWQVTLEKAVEVAENL
ncbi:MAG: proline--tRNA ligase [Spirochaetales bacterium]|nr:proline--tRNA ligase [Spirochaetales bacterium]